MTNLFGRRSLADREEVGVFDDIRADREGVFKFRRATVPIAEELDPDRLDSSSDVNTIGARAARHLTSLVERRTRNFTIYKRVELPTLIIMGLGPAAVLWLLQGRPFLSGPFAQTSLALTIGIFVCWYALSRMKDYANSRHLSYVLPISVPVFTSVLAVLALFRIPYSASFFGFGAASAVATTFAFAVYARRLGVPHLVIPGGRTAEVLLSDRYVRAPAVDVIESYIEAGHRGWALVADLHYQHPDEYERLFARAALNGVPVYHFRSVAEMQSGQVKIDHLSENELGSLIPNMSYTSIKRNVDFLVALVFLPLLAPLFLLIGLAIKIDSPGPAFFMQTRMGFRGRPFTMIKFRTMRPRGSDHLSDDSRRDAMTTDDDVRITRVGAFLRKTRMDELPQIINVLIGQMSFIGPRPEAIALSEWYESELPFYSYRHIVRPGITGWAQVNQGHVTDVMDVLSKLRYDFYYIKHFSLWLDLLTALKTLRVIVTGAGAR